MKKVLFVCVHNAGRSQIAEAFFNYYASGKATAISAGTQPASHVDRTVMEAMKELGIDISSNRSKLLTPEMIEDVDKIVTLGCGVEGVCPATFVPSEDWHLEDPEGKPIEKVREIRDEIEAKVKTLIQEILGKRGENVATAIRQ
jgi:protein-tyrosine-phosphatase